MNRLHFTGSGVTTPDTLLPEDELILRDLLVGQEWLRSRGMHQEPRLLYLPDSFGHSPGLPALLHAAGIDILMGAPNVVRGGSHSGNIAAVDLANEGMLDILSSDYIPSSLLMAALQLPRHVPAIDLASAVRTVTKTPAEAVGLSDRGEVAVGRRADLIRVHVARDLPVVRSVWREGRRVA